MAEVDLRAMAETIEEIEAAARKLIDMAEGIQAIERNAERILASVEMLKIDVTDVTGGGAQGGRRKG